MQRQTDGRTDGKQINNHSHGFLVRLNHSNLSFFLVFVLNLSRDHLLLCLFTNLKLKTKLLKC